MARTKTSILKSYVALEKRRRQLEDNLKKVKVEIDQLSGSVLEWFQSAGIESTRVDGMTVYIRRELWAGRAEDVDNDDFCATLTEAGLAEFVSPRVNVQSLSAWVRELDAETDEDCVEKALPGDLSRVIKVSEVFKVQARKG